MLKRRGIASNRMGVKPSILAAKYYPYKRTKSLRHLWASLVGCKQMTVAILVLILIAKSRVWHVIIEQELIGTRSFPKQVGGDAWESHRLLKGGGYIYRPR